MLAASSERKQISCSHSVEKPQAAHGVEPKTPCSTITQKVGIRMHSLVSAQTARIVAQPAGSSAAVLSPSAPERAGSTTKKSTSSPTNTPTIAHV